MKEWQDLNLDEMADWPLLPQCLVALLLTGLLIAVGYWYWYWYWYWLTPKSEQLAQIKQQEVELKMRLTNRASQVAALPIMKEQIEELNRRYDKVMKQLPVEKELATLLAGINDIGVRSGLQFQSIEWHLFGTRVVLRIANQHAVTSRWVILQHPLLGFPESSILKILI